MLFNASKAYVSQLERGSKFDSLTPVYSLNLVNDEYLRGDPEFYHHYRIVNIQNSEDRIDGLEFIFIELPKFRPETITEKRMAVLWLRFLTEFDNENPEIINAPETDEIRKAIEILEESGYSRRELDVYDKYWDAVRVEKAIKSDSENKGRKEGKKEGKAEGIEETIGKVVIKMNDKGYSFEEISEVTGLSLENIRNLLQK